MNLNEVKDAIYDLTAGFFPGATVIWAETITTKPPLPYITLKCSNLNRSLHSNGGLDDRYYECSFTLEINVYTTGKQITILEGETGNNENSAMTDLADFFMYLDSDEGFEKMNGAGISVVLNPPIRDLTALENNTSYRYRAMAEAGVYYSQDSIGPYGMGYMVYTEEGESRGTDVQNSSGGSTAEMVVANDDYIENVEIKDET